MILAYELYIQVIMGKQKNFWKCGGRHYAPTGNKCDKTELYSNMNISNDSDVDAAGSETEKDSHAIPIASKLPSVSSHRGVQEEIQRQILDQLQKVNQRLDKVEDRMARKQHGDKGQNSKSNSKRLSNFSKRHLKVLSDSSQSDSESSDEEQYIPTLNKI